MAHVGKIFVGTKEIYLCGVPIFQDMNIGLLQGVAGIERTRCVGVNRLWGVCSGGGGIVSGVEIRVCGDGQAERRSYRRRSPPVKGLGER
jgi:hypothetical protein